VEGSILVFETLAYGDLSLLVKYGVQFGLFGGSILQLGTGGTTTPGSGHRVVWSSPGATP
jgi:hypothetical protein